MADTGIFATTAEVQRKVGANASATSNTEAYINDFMTQAESYINVATGFNWSDKYSTLNVDVKGILKEAASNLAAIYVLNYDATAVITTSSTIAFENRIKVLWARFQECIEILREIGTEKFMGDA
jgi:glutamine amidotransferase-like uncharacterized protein